MCKIGIVAKVNGNHASVVFSDHNMMIDAVISKHLMDAIDISDTVTIACIDCNTYIVIGVI